eukprot:scaffold44833_cov66-Phaeocystis_antarctica.AAC.1
MSRGCEGHRDSRPFGCEKAKLPPGERRLSSYKRCRRARRRAARSSERSIELGHDPGTDGPAALAEGEAHAFVDGHRHEQLAVDLRVVAGHDHLLVLGEGDAARDVGGAEEELRAVVGEEGLVPAALLLGQRHLAALHILALEAAQQEAHVVARVARVEKLVEHLDARARGLLRLLDPHDLDLVSHLGCGEGHLDASALYASCDHCAPAGDGVGALDGHEEVLLGVALGRGDGLVHRRHQRQHRVPADLVLAPLERAQRRALQHRHVVAGELVQAEQLAHLHLDELEQLLVVDLVALVQEDHERGHAHLPREQHVLARLRHRAVGRRDDQDGAVHRRGAGDHVLHVVGVAGAVDVRVVPVRRLVLHVRAVDRDAPRLLLWRLVNVRVALEVGAAALRLAHHLGDGSREGRLACESEAGR